ncbi:MAG: hypothetical protein H6582_01110 [Crocinitomicaceae bacterium]|nr:hypothetical protein [Crocinitomicaceae bacterium]
MKLYHFFLPLLLFACNNGSTDVSEIPETKSIEKTYDPRIVGNWSIVKYKYYPIGHDYSIDYSKDTLLVRTFSIDEGQVLRLNIKENGKLTINDNQGEYWCEGIRLILDCNCDNVNIPFSCQGVYVYPFLNDFRMTLEQVVYDERNNEVGRFFYSFRR